jgi:hypothetical protein
LTKQEWKKINSARSRDDNLKEIKIASPTCETGAGLL